MFGEKKDKLIESTGGRTLGTTEATWCKAVSGGGTGIVVLTFQISKVTETISFLQNGLHYLKNAHPILRSKLHYNSTKKIFSFLTPPPLTAAEAAPSHAKVYDISSTLELIRTLSKKYITGAGAGAGAEPIHMIQEHEMNKNVWINPSGYPEEGIEVFFATVYVLQGQKWIVALRFHSAACDRTTAESLLLELLEFAGADAGKRDKKINNNGKNCSLGMRIEDLIPSGKTKKTIWGHGMDVLEYSLNSFRLTNLKFRDVKWPRSSEFVRLNLNSHYTNLLLAGCKSRGIKFFGVLAAAGLMAAAHSSSSSSSLSKFSSSTQKYAVATLIDCRTLLDPPLTSRDFGFYHSAIINTHSIVLTKLLGGESSAVAAAAAWDLATKCYKAVENSKERNKHFSDMADLNFLMCKAIENPSLTASSSLRSSLISVVEESVVFDGGNSNNDQIRQGFVLEDYIGCGSVHGIGPSIAFFDTIRDGKLDCVCVYPSPLHSRDQMLDLVDKMKRILIEAVD